MTLGLRGGTYMQRLVGLALELMPVGVRYYILAVIKLKRLGSKESWAKKYY